MQLIANLQLVKNTDYQIPMFKVNRKEKTRTKVQKLFPAPIQDNTFNKMNYVNF